MEHVGRKTVLIALSLSMLLSAAFSDSAESATTADKELLKNQAARQARIDASLKPSRAPPQSAEWQKIYEQRNIVFYYDPALIEQKDRYVSIPYLVDLPVENQLNLLLDGRRSYRSVLSVVNYDCSRRSLPPKSERYWMSEVDYFFTGNHAAGEVMIDPLRGSKPEWIAGFDGSGLTYEGRAEQVSQSYFIFKVLNPELKICETYWKSPPGFQPQKIPPYTQIKTPPCSPQRPTGGLLEACMNSTSAKVSNSYKDQNQVFKNPGTYTGPFLNGSPNGYGRYLVQAGDRAGDLYLGFFSAGNFDGFGTYYYKANDGLKGALYSGYFKHHKRSGLGIYLSADGSPPQEGLWEDDKLVESKKVFFLDTLHGLPLCEGDDAVSWNDCFGFMKFESIPGQRLQGASPTLYAGGFADGVPDGLGTFFAESGWVKYQGQLKSGRADGVGTQLNDSSGNSYYSGGFLDGKRHGRGISVSGGGATPWERYEGDYVNGSRSGQGVLWVEKSFKYVGGFKAGKFDGYGVYTPERVPGGTVVIKEGIWKAGTLLKPGEADSGNSSSKKASSKK